MTEELNSDQSIDEEDTEGHGHHHGGVHNQTSESRHVNFGRIDDESSDDVEGHAHTRGGAHNALTQGAQDNDESSDDVEGHAHTRKFGNITSDRHTKHD